MMVLLYTSPMSTFVAPMPTPALSTSRCSSSPPRRSEVLSIAAVGAYAEPILAFLSDDGEPVLRSAGRPRAPALRS